MDGKKHFAVALSICAFLAAIAANGKGKVIYVDDSASGPADGASWQSAYKYLQDALAAAEAAAKPVEIRVASGVYKPDRGAVVTPGDLEATFFVAPGVTLAGGYAGAGAPDPDIRDVELFPTVLDGDLADNDLPVAVPRWDRVTRDNYDWRWADPSRTDNSFCVVTLGTADANLTTVLEGLSVTAAHSHDRGVSLYAYAGRTAGVYMEEGARALIRHCTFSSNTAPGIASARANVTVSDCVFEHNTVRGTGGGMSIRGDNPLVARCLFKDNWAQDGGGLSISEGRFQIEDCTFVRNTACGLACAEAGFGGALYALDSLEGSIVKDCTFVDNLGSFGGGINFGSMGLTASSPIRRGGPVLVTGCSFAGNHAYAGGAIYAEFSMVNIERSVFRGNLALWRGGAVANWVGETRFDNCFFAGNRALEAGSGIWAMGSGGKRHLREMEVLLDFDLVLSNCTLTGNMAPVGRTLTCWSFDRPTVGTTSISNCILDNGGNEVDNRYGSQMTIAFTNLRGATAAVDDPCNAVACGEGNIDADPLFASPGYWDPNGTPDDPNDDFFVEGDYHLKSQAGRWDPKSQSWVKDNVTSPCIDAGDPNSPIGAEPFPHGARVNMGAYGGTTEASKSYFGEPVCESTIVGDLNGDCRVDVRDLALLAVHWPRDTTQGPDEDAEGQNSGAPPRTRGR